MQKNVCCKGGSTCSARAARLLMESNMTTVAINCLDDMAIGSPVKMKLENIGKCMPPGPAGKAKQRAAFATKVGRSDSVRPNWAASDLNV